MISTTMILSAILPVLMAPNFLSNAVPRLGRGGGFVKDMIIWFIKIAIYDLCITFIAETFGVSHFVAVFIFLGVLMAISFVGYVIKQRVSPSVESDDFRPR